MLDILLECDGIIKKESPELYVNKSPDLSAFWSPNPERNGKPNPQYVALNTYADIVGYGGQPGGGKTDLLLGAALLHHKKSLILRRTSTNLNGIIERSKDIYGPCFGKNSYNGSPSERRWSGRGKYIKFGGCQYEKDKENYKGQAYDLHGFDELTEFSESIFRFIINWNRSASGQKCRVIVTFNPPTDEEGIWVSKFFGAWIDKEHPYPVEDGETAYFISMSGTESDCQIIKDDNKEDGEIFTINGYWFYNNLTDHDIYDEMIEETLEPSSRAFISSEVEDNPLLFQSGYKKKILSMPEPQRSILLGKITFEEANSNDMFKVINPEHLELAFQRYDKFISDGNDLSKYNLVRTGIDVSRGGRDETVLFYNYSDQLYLFDSYDGKYVKTGDFIVSKVINKMPTGGNVNLDGVGVGSSPTDMLKNLNGFNVTPINVGVKAQYWDVRKGKFMPYMDKDNIFEFENLRCYLWWKLRELLDPNSGANIAIQRNEKLKIQLCASKQKMKGAKMWIESKESVKERIGMSPDLADALLFAIFEPKLTPQRRKVIIRSF